MRKEFDFVGHRKLFLIISGCVIALGILFKDQPGKIYPADE